MTITEITTIDDDHDDHDDHDPNASADDHAAHANLIHANYIQEDAEFKGYEFEIGTTVSLGSGDLTFSFGRDEVDCRIFRWT